MLESCGEHMYRKKIGIRTSDGETLFCVYGCGCSKDSHGFHAKDDGIDPQGECPNAPKGTRLQLLLQTSTAYC